ncbi:RAD52 motif-containing 1 [Pelobates cultripes]|uniref:RAD52 motif-containing 1 n=1 Tax=Pelobates cultripes TaxID=61616 RepID=A0AAD1WFI7_PELCU|nr:RAD52 motif-containing 1 [Pelobates cultripes]
MPTGYHAPGVGLKMVRVCNKQKVFQYKSLALNSSKCQDLANFYLGFNGWSKRIIALQNISGLHELEDECDTQEQRKVRYMCVLEVMLPGYDVCSRGVGVAEEDVEKSNDPMEFLMKSGKLQKYAVQKALSDAFHKILLVIFADRKKIEIRDTESGKVAVEHVASSNDPVDCLTEDELQGLIQINDFTWTQINKDGEEESLSELTFYEETMADDM